MTFFCYEYCFIIFTKFHQLKKDYPRNIIRKNKKILANYSNHHIAEHLQGGGGGLSSGGELAGAGSNESDLRVSATTTTESYMTPAHYSGYDEASEYHSLSQDHQAPHPYNLDNSPDFYGASGIHIEPKYQPSPFKNYPRGL